ncbi:M4 family metallopeptidase [Streptomyces sp. NPDC053367]|uniref:M4 family metallopeptidase n=1 Tax=Streptomyces sp. NPDC053367 TaxID=3365700 RepID=UPI0037D5DA06
MNSNRRVNCIIPPQLLLRLLKSDDSEVRQTALDTLLTTTRLRGERAVWSSFDGAPTPGNARRTIFDCHGNRSRSLADHARSEDGPPSGDEAVNRAFEGLGTTRDFYQQVLQRNSLNNRGMRLDGYVHFGRKYNNAFWDGRQMVFGEGDGKKFSDFTGSLSVIAHELAHGVTEFTAGLAYHDQPGALNESMSDVFGALVEQWSLKQTADTASWLIGSEIFTPGIGADALRSMKAPGEAYDNPLFGRDSQPDHISKYVRQPNTEEGDWGGVHDNSGIPNKAFYLTAERIGGNAWGAPGLIWYESLKASSAETQFQDFADTTYQKAEELYGSDSAEQLAVMSAWREVGITISGVPVGVARARTFAVHWDGAGEQGDGLAALTKQVGALTAQVTGLAKELASLKAGR